MTWRHTGSDFPHSYSQGGEPLMKRIIALVIATASVWPLCAVSQANAQSELAGELRLCRNSPTAADRIGHCSNVVGHPATVAALVTAHNTRGLALMEVGRFNEAVEDFTFVIQRSPQIAGYFDNRQNAFRRSGRLDDALKDANEAIRLASTYSFAFRGRANVYSDMAKYDLAVLDYDQAIRLAPNDGGLFIDRGKILRTQSKFDQAIADFSHAIDLDKKWTDAYRERGLTYKLMGRSQDALDDLTTFDHLQPGDPDVGLALAQLSGRASSVQAETPPQPIAPDDGSAGPVSVPLQMRGGTFLVPVTINGKIELDFTVDSGASTVVVPADVFGTLIRTGTMADADLMGKQNFTLADGSTQMQDTFRIRSLKIGDRVLHDVEASVAPVAGNLLLGQSFLRRFKSWSMDNQRGVLVLN
jgi:clan AA aspartic protease (TIGR02281 family)